MKTMEKLEEELKRAFERWDNVYQNGGSDPFWADGMGLNLTRNHVLAIKRDMEELAGGQNSDSLFGFEFPPIYYRETPIEVDYNFMPKADEIRKRAYEHIALYEQDENYLYLLNIRDTLYPHGKQSREAKEANLPYYPVLQIGFERKHIEQDDLLGMRRTFHIPYEEKAKAWKQYADEIKSFLSIEQTVTRDLSVNDKKESLDQKIQRVEDRKQISKKDEKTKDVLKPHNKTIEYLHEEQLSLF